MNYNTDIVIIYSFLQLRKKDGAINQTGLLFFIFI